MSTLLFFHGSNPESKRPKEIVESVEADTGLTVQYIDTDLDADGLRETYNVSYIPTVVVLSPDGDERARHIGEIERTELLTLLNTVGEK